MATPILTKSQKAACLTKAVKSSKKVRVKNVLCVDSHTWPRPSKEVEETILTKLTELLRSLPNIFKPVKNSTKDYLESKRKVRAQLDLGTNCVARSLEGDRLACVLVSGKTAPAPALEHLIAVARERGCPLLCLDALSTALAKASKSKCFPICIGFKKLVTSARADFVEVITLVKENTTTRKPASKPTSIGKVQRNQLPETMRPVRLDPSTDAAIRKDLTSAFSKASLKEGKNKMWTSRDKKRKKDKNKKKFKEHYKKWFHNHFESGKRTVADFVARGKLQMVLVIPELIPILMTEAPTSSLLYVARDADCPVLCVSNLAAVTCVESEKALAVLGIKKDSCLPMNCPSAFSSVIEKCHEFMRHAPMPTQEMDVEDDDAADGEMNGGAKVKEEVAEEDGVDYSFLYVKKNESVELREKAIRLKEEQDEMSKQYSFSGDFISLSNADGSVTTEPADVTLGKRKSTNPLFAARLKPKKMLMDKTGSSKTQNESKVQGQTQANIVGDSQGFLSFGTTSAQKQDNSTEAMSMDQEEAKGGTSWINSGNDASPQTPMFSISRAGDRSHNKLSASEKEQEVEEAGPSSTGSSSSILGLDASTMVGKSASEVEAAHVTNVFSATSRKSKGEDKRRHGQEGFVSFGYTEANIQTMVANPNRKNRSKKK